MTDIGNVPAKLLEGEEVEFGTSEIEASATDEALNQRYVKGEIRIVTEQARYPLPQILGMFQDTFLTDEGQPEPKYKRDPEYQRRHRWDATRQSRLIESFLMNVPVPPIFLYEYDLARYEVMDGRQRLTALMEFYLNDLVLEGLQHWPELDGRTYSNLPKMVRDGIDRRYLSSIILLNETAGSEELATRLKKIVFERLNSGGVDLSPQESRNAVFDGPLNDLCIELSGLPELRQILGTPQNNDPILASNEVAAVEADEGEEDDENDDDTNVEIPATSQTGSGAVAPSDGIAASVDGHTTTQEQEELGDTIAEEPTSPELQIVVTKQGRKLFESMEDVELVLRFFAYRQLDKFPQGLNRISDFLDQFLVAGNSYPSELLDEYRQMFIEGVRFWFNIRGTEAFKVPSIARSFSKIAYDALMFSSAHITAEQRELLLDNPDIVTTCLQEMFELQGDVFRGRRTNSIDARRRNLAAVGALEEAVRRATSE